MQEYMNRLIRCGYSADRAYRVCDDFLRDFDADALAEYVINVEAACYVGAV